VTIWEVTASPVAPPGQTAERISASTGVLNVLRLPVSPHSTFLEASGPAAAAPEAWPPLGEALLRQTRSRKVCMTCHWFRHHLGSDGIPLLTCQLHQGLIGQGEHLTSRCQGWSDDMARQRGWAPEIA
jgi:hypothetical protein